jgi:hypothetical protein
MRSVACIERAVNSSGRSRPRPWPNCVIPCGLTPSAMFLTNHTGQQHAAFRLARVPAT